MSNSAALAKYTPADMVSTWTFGGVFMSMLGSILTSTGLGVLPKAFNLTKGRREVERLTGNRMVPTLVLDDGTVVDGSREIAAWAKAHPAATA